MEINNDKLKISGLIVIAALLILLSHEQHHSIKFIPPQQIKAAALFNSSAGEPQGIINGKVNPPTTSKTKELSVCAVRESDHTIYCARAVKKDYSLVVPIGTYTVYATLAKNPYDITSYRAYYSDYVKCDQTCDSHSPIKVTVVAGQTVAEINPNDWANNGDANLIAAINKQTRETLRQYALSKPKPPEENQETKTPAVTQPVPSPSSPTLAQQSVNSSNP